MGTEAEKPMFKARYLLIALLPPLVFAMSLFLLENYGTPWDILPEKFPAFDAYKEGAARIGTLAAFMLVFGAALAGVLFFANSLRIFSWRSLGPMLVAWLLLAGAAMAGLHMVPGRQAEDYAGVTLFCLASLYSEAQSVQGRDDADAALEIALKDSAKAQRHDCPSRRFTQMQRLVQWEFRLVALAFAGLVLGGIFCLADREPSPPEDPAATLQPLPDPELLHWERQAERLNTCLYLAALLLGAALVFINTFLQFPAFLLTKSDSYDSYIASMVAFYGFSFSLMLVSFYIPVALLLSDKQRERARDAGTSAKLPDAFNGPLQVLKIVLGLSSTALAGILPTVIDMMG